MPDNEKDDGITYKVVVNAEEQYSIWPEGRENAPGWKDAGRRGTKAECLTYIGEVWRDMRPLSLRQNGYGPAQPALEVSASERG